MVLQERRSEKMRRQHQGHGEGCGSGGRQERYLPQAGARTGIGGMGRIGATRKMDVERWLLVGSKR